MENQLKEKLFSEVLHYKKVWLKNKKEFGEWSASTDLQKAKFDVLYGIIEDCLLENEYKEWCEENG